MRLKFYIVVSIFLSIILLTTSCASNKNNNNDSANWEDEVVYAQACGVDGLPCCPNKEPACQYGLLCCTDPNDVGKNMCVDNCACGGEEKFCCKDEPKCDMDMACVGNLCLSCGELDEPCCPRGDTCGEDLLCYREKCVECGHPGTPCCEEGITCLDEEAIDVTHTECRGDVCIYCGTAGKIACLGDQQCLAGFLNNNNLCYRCGGFNQPCCNLEIDGYECREESLGCNLGFCAK